MEFYTLFSRSATNVGSFWLCFVQRCPDNISPGGFESGKYVWIHILISDSYGIYPEKKGFLDFGGPFVTIQETKSGKIRWNLYSSTLVSANKHTNFTQETKTWYQHHVLSETILSKSNFFVVVVLFEKWSMDPSSIGSGFKADIYFSSIFSFPWLFVGRFQIKWI